MAKTQKPTKVVNVPKKSAPTFRSVQEINDDYFRHCAEIGLCILRTEELEKAQSDNWDRKTNLQDKMPGLKAEHEAAVARAKEAETKAKT